TALGVRGVDGDRQSMEEVGSRDDGGLPHEFTPSSARLSGGAAVSGLVCPINRIVGSGIPISRETTPHLLFSVKARRSENVSSNARFLRESLFLCIAKNAAIPGLLRQILDGALTQSDRIALALDDFFRDDLRGRVGPIGEPQRAQGVFIGGGEDLDLVRAKGTIFQEATDRHGQLPISLNSFEDGSPEAFPSSPSPT